MKKLLLVVFLAVTMKASAQSYFYHPWTLPEITTIGDQMFQMVGTNYFTPNVNFNEAVNSCSITLKNTDGDVLEVKFQKGLINGDADDRIKPQQVIDNMYTINGPFRGVLAIYQKLYDSTANADILKKDGHAKVISKVEGKLKYNVAFARTGEYWTLYVRQVR